MLEILGMNAAGAIADNSIGLISGGLQARRQMKNQRELMAEQLGIDKLKMEEQRKIQLRMWEDTNFAAQVEQLKKAGLSTGLMYGKGGAGGTTTGAGATGVSAPSAPSGMGIIGGTQLASQIANIELIKAQTENINADTERKLGVDKTKVEAETKNLMATTENEYVKKGLLEIQKDIAEIDKYIKEGTQEDVINSVGQGVRFAEQQINWWVRKNYIDEATAKEQIGIVQRDYIQKGLENELLKVRKKEGEQNITESEARIKKMTADIAQGWTKLSIEEQNMFINRANAVTNARNSHVNAKNANSAEMNAQTNAFRLEWDKTIKDVSDSTRLTVETVTDIFKSILGAATRTPVNNNKNVYGDTKTVINN